MVAVVRRATGREFAGSSLARSPPAASRELSLGIGRFWFLESRGPRTGRECFRVARYGPATRSPRRSRGSAPTNRAHFSTAPRVQYIIFLSPQNVECFRIELSLI